MTHSALCLLINLARFVLAASGIAAAFGIAVAFSTLRSILLGGHVHTNPACVWP